MTATIMAISGGEDEEDRVEVGCVEHGDDDDCPDVVDDRQRQQEHLDRCWYAGSEQGDDAEGEGDVGGHRDAPTVRSFAAGVDREEDRAGTTIPPSAAIAGRATGAASRSSPRDQLALDLHPDDEEEQAHQQVVDQVQKVLDELDSCRPRCAPRSTERFVAGRPDVCPDQRGDRGDDEEDSTGRLDVEEAAERLGDTAPTVDRCARSWVMRSGSVGPANSLRGRWNLRRPDFPAHLGPHLSGWRRLFGRCDDVGVGKLDHDECEDPRLQRHDKRRRTASGNRVRKRQPRAAATSATKPGARSAMMGSPGHVVTACHRCRRRRDVGTVGATLSAPPSRTGPSSHRCRRRRDGGMSAPLGAAVMDGIV